ncbi:MAG: YifB family Mg chelatase-like AAA ATPase [Candidatus Omnitrophota bacterium]
MLAKVNSGSVLGIDAYPIDVEIDIGNGLSLFSVVGLPDASIKESRNRIRSAIINSGYEFPSGKVTVNLSPADIKKEGASFDLPIAIGILAATGLIKQTELEGKVLCGELSLNGKLKPIRGALPIVLSLKNKCESFILPQKNSREISTINDTTVHIGSTLREVVDHIKGLSALDAAAGTEAVDSEKPKTNELDFRDVKGQEHAKRGLEIAACGGHNILMIGPPGSGKSMLAKRFPSILPDLGKEEALETTKIHSIAGQLRSYSLIKERPIRTPHHTISYAAMAGGGTYARPGEISLAHNGVLFLDEFPEFRRDVIETLRQPVESGEIIVARAERTLRYPSRFILIAAMNPCPCGYFTDPHKRCQCGPNQIQRYLSKISGPMLDRIDIHIEVPRLNYEQLSKRRSGEPSELVKTRVLKVREIQKQRFQHKPAHSCYNAYMSSKETESVCRMANEAEELLKTAILELGISARAYDKILKISRTIADMDEAEIIESRHISEAVGYRCLDKNLWA